MSSKAKQAHRKLAVFLGLFLAVHFATHFSAIGGIAAQGQVMTWGRQIYQFPIIEAALAVALAAQIFLGIKLLRAIRKRRAKGFWHKVQFLSGCFLAFFITMHTVAALGTRLIIGLDTNFYWAAGTLVLTPLKYGFAPYYFLAVTALAGHLAAALHFRGKGKWKFPVFAAGPVAGIMIILAYSGTLYPIDLPDTHRDYFVKNLGAD
ncbi:MAG: hypothetical protein ABJP48_08340 [Erythrobacter sp.]